MGKNVLGCFFVMVLALLIITPPICSVSSAAPIIIDHNSVASFSSLSNAAIDAVQANLRWHYAHTSHGRQLAIGLQILEDKDSRYSVNILNKALPNETRALNVFNGQENDHAINADEYWQTDTGINATKAVLNNNPSINVSTWSWCRELQESDGNVQGYLTQMAAFETAFPEVTFVYMTCTADSKWTEGFNRYTQNNAIRNWVANSDNRVLFDFADLDAWWYNGSEWEQGTYTHEDQTIPTQHDQFHDNDGNHPGHTTDESCEQKGKAVWVMMTAIEQRNAVPIPGAVWLLGSGFMGLVAVRRRKKA
jgi:hypothetical protein